MATTKYFEITLRDEAPKIGCGRRIVSVKVGRKWAYLTVPSTGTKARLSVERFKVLDAKPVKVRRQFRKPKPRRKADDQT